MQFVIFFLIMKLNFKPYSNCGRRFPTCKLFVGGDFQPASSLSTLGPKDLHDMCCSGTLLPLAKAYKAWVRCIFLWCGSKSQKLLMSLEGTNLCRSFDPRADKLLAGLKSPPTVIIWAFKTLEFNFKKKIKL